MLTQRLSNKATREFKLEMITPKKCTYCIFVLLIIANCFHTYPAAPPPLQSSHSAVSFVDEGEEWRTHLPDTLRDTNGAPLHKITIESESNQQNKVTVYLLGTSHVSRTSCEDAKLLMEYAQPGEKFITLGLSFRQYYC